MNNQQQMNIDFSQTTAEVCDKCGNDTFSEVFKMRSLSPLLSPTGEKGIIPINLFACAKCGHVNDTFLPKDDRDMKFTPKKD
tara:strand:+ start:77 stop:322 length:246 start_codon:yes stop_codon:yes gene_type:complete